MNTADPHHDLLFRDLIDDVDQAQSELSEPQRRLDRAVFSLKTETAVAVDKAIAAMRDRPDLYFYVYDREITVLPERREVRVALTLLGNADGSTQVLRRDLAKRKENPSLNECVEAWRAAITDRLPLPDDWECEVKFHGYG